MVPGSASGAPSAPFQDPGGRFHVGRYSGVWLRGRSGEHREQAAAPPPRRVPLMNGATPEAVAVDLEAPAEAAEERISVASNWTLIWWRFRKHRLALASLAVLVALYAVVICPEFFSSDDPEQTDAWLAFIPLQRLPSSTAGGGPPGCRGSWEPATRSPCAWSGEPIPTGRPRSASSPPAAPTGCSG